MNAVRAAPIEELLSRSWLPDEVGLAVFEATHSLGGHNAGGTRLGRTRLEDDKRVVVV